MMAFMKTVKTKTIASFREYVAGCLLKSKIRSDISLTDVTFEVLTSPDTFKFGTLISFCGSGHASFCDSSCCLMGVWSAPTVMVILCP